MYRLDCICGAKVHTPTTEGVCPTCKRGFRIEWQAEYKGPSPTETSTVDPSGSSILNTMKRGVASSERSPK